VPIQCHDLHVFELASALPNPATGPREILFEPDGLIPMNPQRLIVGPDEKWVVAFGQYGEIAAVSLNSPETVRTISLPAVERDTLVLLNEFSDEVLIGTNSGRTLIRWDLAADTFEEHVFDSSIRAMAVSEVDGTRFLLTSSSAIVILPAVGWAPKQVIKLEPISHEFGELRIQVSSDGKQVEVGSGNESSRQVIDVESGLKAPAEIVDGSPRTPAIESAPSAVMAIARKRDFVSSDGLKWFRSDSQISIVAPDSNSVTGQLNHLSDLSVFLVAPKSGDFLGIDDKGRLFRQKLNLDAVR
jgi:hypothetical protein